MAYRNWVGGEFRMAKKDKIKYQIDAEYYTIVISLENRIFYECQILMLHKQKILLETMICFIEFGGGPK